MQTGVIREAEIQTLWEGVTPNFWLRGQWLDHDLMSLWYICEYNSGSVSSEDTTGRMVSHVHGDVVIDRMGAWTDASELLKRYVPMVEIEPQHAIRKICLGTVYAKLSICKIGTIEGIWEAIVADRWHPGTFHCGCDRRMRHWYDSIGLRRIVELYYYLI